MALGARAALSTVGRTPAGMPVSDQYVKLQEEREHRQRLEKDRRRRKKKDKDKRGKPRRHSSLHTESDEDIAPAQRVDIVTEEMPEVGPLGPRRAGSGFPPRAGVPRAPPPLPGPRSGGPSRHWRSRGAPGIPTSCLRSARGGGGLHRPRGARAGRTGCAFSLPSERSPQRRGRQRPQRPLQGPGRRPGQVSTGAEPGRPVSCVPVKCSL